MGGLINLKTVKKPLGYSHLIWSMGWVAPELSVWAEPKEDLPNLFCQCQTAHSTVALESGWKHLVGWPIGGGTSRFSDACSALLAAAELWGQSVEKTRRTPCWLLRRYGDIAQWRQCDVWAAPSSLGRKERGASSSLFFLSPSNQIHHIQPPHSTAPTNSVRTLPNTSDSWKPFTGQSWTLCYLCLFSQTQHLGRLDWEARIRNSMMFLREDVNTKFSDALLFAIKYQNVADHVMGNIYI